MSDKNRFRRRRIIGSSGGDGDPPIVNTYDQYIYNSSGGQTGNRYNSWSDLMDRIHDEEGDIRVFLEQDETIPAGAYNLDRVGFIGNGLNYASGGITLTFPTGVTVTSWEQGALVRATGMKLLSTSNAPIWTFSGPTVFSLTNAFIASTTSEFLKQETTGGLTVFALADGSVIEDNGYEVFNTTVAAFTTILIVAETGVTSGAHNDTLRSTNSVVFGELKQSSQVSLQFATHTNLVIGSDFSALSSDSRLIIYDPTGTTLSAVTVQAAITELDGDMATNTYTPTLTNIANLDASTASVCEYFRIRNQVFVYGTVAVDPTTTGTNTRLGISIPIASNFSSGIQAAGVASSRTTNESAPIISDATNDRVEMTWLCVATTNTEFRFMFAYEVV